jgi:rhomboid family GlyGly-CTERM serine protease
VITILPLRTLTVVLVAAGAYMVPGLASFLIYGRGAILAGEIWRVATGVLVHLTLGHLLFNIAAFTAAGWVIERRGYPHFWLVGGLTALLGGAVLLVATPGISRYGGLSGVAVGMIVYASLCGMREEGPWRRASTAVFALTLLKVAVELLTGQTPMTAVGTASFIPVPMSHAIGVLVGVMVATGNMWRGERFGLIQASNM